MEHLGYPKSDCVTKDSLSRDLTLGTQNIIDAFDIAVESAKAEHILNGNTDQFRQLLIDQVINPVGNDLNVSKSALGFIHHATEDPSLLKLLDEVREERSQKSDGDVLMAIRGLPEVIIAITHAVNYIKIFEEGKENYIEQDQLKTYLDWSEKVYRDIANNPYKLQKYRELLTTKDIVTTNPIRAVGLHAVTKMLFNGRKVNMLDMGCSANQQLVRLSSQAAAETDPYICDDRTSYAGRDQIVLNATHEPVNLGIGVGIDKSNPYDDPDWFAACGHPKNMNPIMLSKKRARLERYGEISNVLLLDGQDMRHPHIDSKKWDVVSALTSVYQVPTGERQAMFQKWEKLLTDNGIIVVQDYLHVKEDGSLDIVDTRGLYEYGLAIKGKVTNNSWKVLFRYDDSNCTTIINGENFEEFMQNIS